MAKGIEESAIQLDELDDGESNDADSVSLIIELWLLLGSYEVVRFDMDGGREDRLPVEADDEYRTISGIILLSFSP